PEELFTAAVKAGVEQSLRFGVTCVGDISQQMHITRPALRNSPMRCVSYGEVLGLAGLQPRYDLLLPRAIDRSDEGTRLRIGLIEYRTLLAHVNYCDDDELEILSRGRASVIYCPRTHAYFGHPPHRWREMLDRGVNVAIGTDSCASSPDLNLLDDLRLAHAVAPDFSVDRLFELITTRAARALGWEAELGSLAPGKFADFAVF